MRFRPCIDLHEGKVKQIVGSSLRDSGEAVTNFEATQPPSFFAEMYWRDGLEGGHVIKLGHGNDSAAREALGCHPGNLQVGGGINPENASEWLAAGAGKVIVTSYLFNDGALDMERVRRVSDSVGRDRLVIDLSCVWQDGAYHVATNRWQTVCDFTLDADSLDSLASYCAEFLVHAVGVEGKQGGIDCLPAESEPQYEQRRDYESDIDHEVRITNLDETVRGILQNSGEAGHTTAHQVIGNQENTPSQHIKQDAECHDRILLDRAPYASLVYHPFSFFCQLFRP